MNVTLDPKRRYLRELQPDVTAANDDKMVGQQIRRQQRTVGKIGHIADPGQVRNQCSAADVDENAIRLKRVVTDTNRMRTFEPSMTHDQRAALHVSQPFFVSSSAIHCDLLRTRVNAGHVDAHIARHDPEIRTPADEMNSIGTCNKCLRGRAAGVDAGATDEVSFHNRYVHARRGQPRRH
jgi:hypothetical protein